MEQVRGSMEGNACLSGQLSDHPPTNYLTNHRSMVWSCQEIKVLKSWE